MAPGYQPRAPVASYPVEPQARVYGHAVAANLSRAVYAVYDGVVCVDRAGRRLWRCDFGPAGETQAAAAPCCVFSHDAATVWIYRPDGMARRGDGADQWIVVNASTGVVLARADLPCVGQGGCHFPHPNGVDMVLDVGEGQDGSQIYRGRFTGKTIEVVK